MKKRNKNPVAKKYWVVMQAQGGLMCQVGHFYFKPRAMALKERLAGLVRVKHTYPSTTEYKPVFK